MTLGEVRILERLTVVSPLAFRFRDAATDGVIDSGLSVVAYPPNDPSRRVAAFTNRKGVYVFRGLPWMRDAEYPAEGVEPLESLAGKWDFIVEVVDNENRFIPFNLSVKAPVKGLYRWESVSSTPSNESPVLLYSAPSRPTLSSMAVVRAELRDPDRETPASWALVEAVIEGKVQGRGISDAHGRVLLMFPYPEPKDLPLSPPALSPPGGSGTRLFDREWQFQLRAFYSPGAATQALPDLNRIFEQTQADLWSTLSPNTPLGPQALKYGSELVLASQSESELWITRRSSP